MDKVDAVVIGAGVVGLACARALALAGQEVVVLESEGAYGQGVSSRSSEVIHGGMYYAAGSLKARLCVEGKERLYAYCAERGVGHRRCGKLIVATGPGDGAKLDTITARAKVNGVHDLERLSATEAIALEPALACHGALLSPSTGIVDSHGLMTALLGDAENAGAVLALRSPFVRAAREGAHWRVATGGDEPFEIGAGWIVNAAGLGAQAAAHAIDGFPRPAIPPLWKAKGRYFALPSRAPFTRLIYPTPIDGGLGVHLTLDLGGQARFGPDVQWLAPDAPFDYEVDPALRSAFESDVRRYWPGLPDGALQPAYAGVRPKLDGPGTMPDFMITGPAEHGIAGIVQLFGIESPGLTSSLAIAEFVLDRVRGVAQAK